MALDNHARPWRLPNCELVRVLAVPSEGTLSLCDGNAFTLLRSISRIPSGERDDCSRLRRSSFSDAAERKIIERACGSEPSDYDMRMGAKTYLHVQTSISIDEERGEAR